MKKSRSFKKELIYSFLTIALVSITFLGIFQIFQLSSLIKENQQSQTQKTRFLEDYIVNYIQEHKKVIQTQALRIDSVLPENAPTISKQLEDIKTNYPGFINLYVGDNDGQSLVFYPKVYTDGAKRGHLNFSDRSYYKQLVEEKDTVISSVFHGRGGTNILLVTIVTPIMSDDGEMEGYILGALDLNALGMNIKDRLVREDGYAVVLDQENNVVVHPDIDTKIEMVNLSDSEVVQFINEDSDNFGGEYFTKATNGVKEFITYENIEALGWKVWLGKPATVIANTYKNAIITIVIFMLVTAIIMIGFSFFFANRLEKTVRILLSYINSYRKGVPEKRPITEKIRGSKEMEELSLHFENMVDEVDENRKNLLQLNTELEERVEERTANLNSKNIELGAVNKLITSVSSDKDLASFIQHCLQEVEPFKDYAIHVLFQDIAVSNSKIIRQSSGQYIREYMLGDQQHIEPIKIDANHKGLLVVDLLSGQSISASEQEFLQTFASSLAIMLQNKFLFERYRNKHAELEAVLESMSEGFLLLSNDGRVEYANDFFINVVSTGSLNKPQLIVLDDVYQHFIKQFDVDPERLSTFFNNDNDELKVEYEKESGKKVYYMLHKFPVILDEGKIGEGLLVHDITKEQEIDTLKDNLISLTSHEFKTPITTIKGSVETLLRTDVEWEAEFQLELLEGVHEDIERIQHLVNDWMDISKIESGTMYVDRNMIRADHVIEQAMEQIPEELRKSATLTFSNNIEEYLFFYADKQRVQQVLVNLVTNALRYNDEKCKKIDITLDKEEDHLTISVSDNGIGISNDHISRVYNRFYQVDATATRRTGGTGLGLAICEGIMKAHNGKIKVDSKLGEGSTFTLYFPLKEGE